MFENISSRLARVLTSNLRRFSDRHKGESCYIFGDGPSIKWFDLSMFDDHTGICCGMIPFHKDFHKLKVKYAILPAPWLFLPKLLQPRMYHQFRGIAAEYKRLVRKTPEVEFFVNLSNMPSLWGANVNYLYRGLPIDRNRTDKKLRRFDLFAGSFHASLTLAYYFGFTRIYLVGFDAWTIQPARTSRWYELGEGCIFEATNLATDFLAVLKDELDIQTILVEGNSINVKYIRYHDHTGKLPVFKENYQIMDDHYLRVMASNPNHKVLLDCPEEHVGPTCSRKRPQ